MMPKGNLIAKGNLTTKAMRSRLGAEVWCAGASPEPRASARAAVRFCVTPATQQKQPL